MILNAGCVPWPDVMVCEFCALSVMVTVTSRSPALPPGA